LCTLETELLIQPAVLFVVQLPSCYVIPVNWNAQKPLSRGSDANVPIAKEFTKRDKEIIVK